MAAVRRAGSAVGSVLPPKVKDRLRPTWRRLTLRTHRDPRSYRLTTGVFDGFEVAYREGTADEKVLAQSFEHDTLLADVPGYEPRADDVIVDVGAHIGTFSLLMSRLVPDGRVHAVEACKETFDLLRFNLCLNDATNVEAAHLALGDVAGTCWLHHAPGNFGHSTVAELSDEGEEVPCDTLEAFFDDHGIDRCALIKFNCEGAEFPILLATRPEVLARIDRMLVLYHCDLYTGAPLDALVDHLRAAGFDTHAVSVRTHRGRLVAERRAGADRPAGPSNPPRAPAPQA